MASTFITGLSILLISGCIENPEPDKELNHGGNHASISAPYPSGYLLFTLRTEFEKSHLEVLNAGKARLDSADYLLQINRGFGDHPFSMGFRQAGFDAQRHGRIRGLQPGESRQLGDVDLGSYTRTSEFRLSAQVLATYRDGNRDGNPLAGVYNGIYRTTDSLSGSESGESHGFINADGRYVFWFSPLPLAFFQGHNERPEYYQGYALTGKTGSATYLRELGFRNADSTIILLPEKGLTLADWVLSATFQAQDPSRTADSLDLNLKLEEPE